MAQYPWPPHDFVCLYEHTCPYLDGLSTSWVLGEYRRADEVYHEHLRIIDNFHEAVDEQDKRIRVLERENAELRAKYQALHKKQFKPNRRKKDDLENHGGFAEESAAPKTKKRGAPVGHPGWSRPAPTRIDQVVQVPAPAVCPHCGSAELTPEGAFHEHVQEDIVVRPQTVVRKYVHEGAYCPRCRRSVVGAGAEEIPNAFIGPQAKSVAGFLRYDLGIPYRKVRLILDELFGLTLVPGSLVGFDRRAAKRGRPLYEDVRDKIRVSKVVHADETSWRNDGKGYYVWFAGNDELAFFHIDRHRSQDAAKAIFGENFDGTLVRDRYAAYNGIGFDWQACLAHIITNAKDICREHALLPENEQDKAVSSFCKSVIDLGKRACEAGRRLKAGELPGEQTTIIEKRFVKELNRIGSRVLSFKPAETLRAFLVGAEQKHLFTFLRIPGVPPTNNHAEQSLRKIVIMRKVCFGTRSENGVTTHSVLPTLVQTARRQDVNPRVFLHTLHTADTATAQAALYKNTS